MRRRLLPILLTLLASGAAAAPTDSRTASEYFSEARRLCEADHGKLWGIPLCGSMLLVDPATRIAFASAPDPDGFFVRDGNVYRGAMPKEIGIANYSFNWKTTSWTMFMEPLPQVPIERDRLMLHELWHHVQEGLGFPLHDQGNAHLDRSMGRSWMRLEWRALAKGLRAINQAERRVAIEDALLFRAMRRALFPRAEEEERALEMHEGLAEYTGTRLAASTRGERVTLALDSLLRAERNESYVRSFAYGSGPAWGLLLDQIEQNWTRRIKSSDDLGNRAAACLQVRRSSNLVGDASRRAGRYDGADIVREEMARETRRHEKQKTFEMRFVRGPVLHLPLRQMQMQFDPRRVTPFEGGGNVYPSISVSDQWGRIDVTGGALITAEWKEMIVTAPEDGNQVETPNWKISLAKGWAMVASGRPGDFTVTPAR